MGRRAWPSGTRTASASPACARPRRVRVYTPGSRAGMPLALLGSLRAPGRRHGRRRQRARHEHWRPACWRWRASTTLAPHSREQTFVAAILSQPAPSGRAADSAVARASRFSGRRSTASACSTSKRSIPAKDRQELALRFNSVLASPGFDVWLAGEPLDVGSMLFDAAGPAPRRHRVDRAPGRRASACWSCRCS